MATGQHWGVSFRINTGAMTSLSTHTANIKSATAELSRFSNVANTSLTALNNNLAAISANIRSVAGDVQKVSGAAKVAGSGAGAGGGMGGGYGPNHPSRRGGEDISQALARYLGAPQNPFNKVYGKQTPTVGRGGMDQNQLLSTILYTRVTDPILRQFNGVIPTGFNTIKGRLDSILTLLRNGGFGGRGGGGSRGDGGGGGNAPSAPPSSDAARQQAVIDTATRNVQQMTMDLKTYNARIASLENSIKSAIPKKGEPSSEHIEKARNYTIELQNLRRENAHLEKERQALSTAAVAAKAKAAPRSGLDDSPVNVGRKSSISAQQFKEGRMSGNMVGGGGVRSDSYTVREQQSTIRAAEVLGIALRHSPTTIGPLKALQPPATMIDRDVAARIRTVQDQIAQISDSRGGRKNIAQAQRAVIGNQGFMDAMGQAVGFQGDFGAVIRNKPGSNKFDATGAQWQRMMTVFQMIADRMPDMGDPSQTGVERDVARQPRRRNRRTDDSTLATVDPSGAPRPAGRLASIFGRRSSGSVTDSDVDWAEKNQQNFRVRKPLVSPRNDFTSPDQWHNAVSRVVNWGSAATFAYGGTQQLIQGVKLLSQYERAIMDVRRVAVPLGFDIEKVSKSAQEMGKTFGQSILDTSKAMTIFAQQGMDMQGIIDSTRASMLLTNTTELDLVSSTEALTAAQRQFQISTSQSMRIVDAWTEVANTTAVGAGTLGKAMQAAGTSMRIAGIDFDRANGIIAAVGEATRKSGEEIGTAMKFIFQHVREDDAVQSLQQIGIFTEDANGKMRSAVQVIDDLHDRWGQLTAAQQQQIAVAVAGTRHLNDFFVMMDGWGRASDIAISSMTSQGSAMKQNEMLMQTLEKQAGQLKAAFEGMWVSLGNSGVLTTLKTIVQMFTSLLEGFGKVNSMSGGVLGTAIAGYAGYKGLQIGGQVVGQSVMPALFDTDVSPTAKYLRDRRKTQGGGGGTGRGFVSGPNSLGMMDPFEMAMARGIIDDPVGSQRRRDRAWGGRAGAVSLMVGSGIAQQVYQNVADPQPGDAPTAAGTAIGLASTAAMGIGSVGLFKRPGSAFSPKAQGANLLLLVPAVVAAVMQGIGQVRNYTTRTNPNGVGPVQAQIDNIRGLQEKLSTTRAQINEQLRRSQGGQDVDLQVFQDLRDQMALLAPDMVKSADAAGRMTDGMRLWVDGLERVNGELRNSRSELIALEAARMESSADFKAAQSKVDETGATIARAAGRGSAGRQEGFAALAERSTARSSLNEALNRRFGEAMSQGQNGQGIDLSRERLDQMGKTYRMDPEQLGRSLLKNYFRGMGEPDMNVAQQLGNRSVSEVQYVQTGRNGKYVNIRNPNQAVGAGDVQGQLVMRTQEAQFGDAISRVRAGNLGKLMEEFERAIESLIQKNTRLIQNMEAGNRATASRAFGQNFNGTSLGLQMVGSEGQTLAGIEKNGMRGLRPAMGGNAATLSTDIIRMTGDLIGGGMSSSSVSMQGLISIMNQAEDFQRSAMEDIQRRGANLLVRGGAVFNGPITEDDANAVGMAQGDVRALVKALDENTITRLNELAVERSTAVKDNNQDRVSQIDEQGRDLISGSLRLRGRRLRDTAGDYIRERTEGNSDFAVRAIQQLGQSFRLARIGNSNLNADQFSQTPAARQIQGVLRTLTEETQGALRQQQERITATAPNTPERANAESLAGLLGENVRTLSDATQNYAQHINDAVQGMVDMDAAMQRITSISGGGAGFGQTGTAGASFAAQTFERFAQRYLQMAEQASTEERRLMFTQMASQLQQRGEGANLQVTMAREMQQELIRGLPAQYLANRATNAVGLNAPATGTELRASLTDAIQSSLQMLAMQFAEGRGQMTPEIGNQFIEAIRPQLSELNKVVQDMQLNMSPEYQKNYMLANPGDQALADFVRQQMQSGATASEIFADPNMRAAARDNPLFGQIADMAIQRDMSEQLLNITGSQNDKVGSIETAVQQILQVINQDRTNRGLPTISRDALPLAKGTMSGGKGVDSKGRIAENGTPALLHAGEIVLTKRQADALFENKFAQGTGAGSASFNQLFSTLRPSGNSVNLFDPQNQALAEQLRNTLIQEVSSKGMLGFGGAQWQQLLNNVAIRFGPIDQSNRRGQTAFPAPERFNKGVRFSPTEGNNPGITFARVLGDTPTEIEQSFKSLFSHETSHSIDLPLRPGTAGLAGPNTGVRTMQGQVLTMMMDHLTNDPSPLARAARARVMADYGQYFQGGQSVGRNSNTFAAVSELRAAMNQMAAVGAGELSPLWQRVNGVLAEGTNSLYGIAGEGGSTRAFHGNLEVTLGKLYETLGGKGFKSDLGKMTMGQLREQIMSRMSPEELDAISSGARAQMAVNAPANARVEEAMGGVSRKILSRPAAWIKNAISSALSRHRGAAGVDVDPFAGTIPLAGNDATRAARAPAASPLAHLTEQQLLQSSELESTYAVREGMRRGVPYGLAGDPQMAGPETYNLKLTQRQVDLANQARNQQIDQSRVRRAMENAQSESKLRMSPSVRGKLYQATSGVDLYRPGAYDVVPGTPSSGGIYGLAGPRRAGGFTNPVYDLARQSPDIYDVAERDPYMAWDKPSLHPRANPAVNPYDLATQERIAAARSFGGLGANVGEIAGFSRPTFSGLRSSVAGGLKGALTTRSGLLGTGFVLANAYGQQASNALGYGKQWDRYGSTSLTGFNNFVLQQSLARTGSISGMQLLPRALATVGMQGTARSMVGGSQMLGRAAGPVLAFDLITRGLEAGGNLTGHEDFAKASRATRNTVYGVVTAPASVASRHLANLGNFVSGNGYTSAAQAGADKDILGRAAMARNSDSWWNSRGVTTFTGYIDEDMSNLVTAMADSEMGIQGQLDDTIGRAMLQQPLGMWAEGAWKNVGKSNGGGSADNDLLAAVRSMDPEVQRAVAGIPVNSPQFAVHLRAAQLAHEGNQLVKLEEEYKRYLQTNPTDPGAQSTLEMLSAQISVKRNQWNEVTSLNRGYRANGLFNVKDVISTIESQRESIGDYSTSIVASQSDPNGWAKVYTAMQGLNENDAQFIMKSGARNALGIIKQKLGFEADINPWVDVAAGLPRTATLMDLLSTASGQNFRDTNSAWDWLTSNKNAFSAGENLTAAVKKNSESRRLSDLVNSGNAGAFLEQAELSATTGNEFDRLLSDFKTTRLFEEYEGNYRSFLDQSGGLLPRLQYDFRATGPDVDLVKERLALAMQSIGPLNEQYGGLKSKYQQIMSYPQVMQQLLSTNPALRARVGGDVNSAVDWFGVAGRTVPFDLTQPTSNISRINNWIAKAQQDIGLFTQINQGNQEQGARDELVNRDRRPSRLRQRAVRVADDSGNPILDESGRPVYQMLAQGPDGAWLSTADSEKALKSVSDQRLQYMQSERKRNISLARMENISNRPQASLESFLNGISDPNLRDQVENYNLQRINLRQIRGTSPEDEVRRQNYQKQMDEISIRSGFGRDFFERASDAYDRVLERQEQQYRDKTAARGYASGTYAQRGSSLIDNEGYVSRDHVATVHTGERVYPTEVATGIDHLLELMRGLGNGPIQQAVRPADTMTSDATQFLGYQPSDVAQRHVHEGNVTVSIDGTLIDYDRLAQTIIEKMAENSGGAPLRQGDTIPQWFERR